MQRRRVRAIEYILYGVWRGQTKYQMRKVKVAKGKVSLVLSVVFSTIEWKFVLSLQALSFTDKAQSLNQGKVK